MGLQELYQTQMDELSRGVPFVTSAGLRVQLLPPAAPEWRRHDVRQAKAVWKYRELEWFDYPEDVLDDRDVAEFVTGVIDWDTDAAGVPCTRESREQAARTYPPLRLEVVREIRRRRSEHTEQVAALGKGSAASSPSASSTQTTPRSDATSSGAASPSPATST